MWPIVIGLALLAAIDELFEDKPEKQPKKKKLRKSKQKVFISFAFEDKKYRDFMVAQAANAKSTFDFIDMSVKEPWDQAVWKRKCRTKIRECNGLIILLSKNTWHSGGSRWEVKCAIEESIRVIGVHINKDNKGAIPPELEGKKVVIWSWENLEKFVNNL
jgi:MTH538 TIR-like domain (DUF1863)